MLKDELIKYYYPPNGYNYNCAEAMIRALNDYYDLKLPEEMFYGASSYGGGCHHDELCGGLASGLAVLGVLYSVNGRGHDSAKLRELSDELFKRFEERFKTSRCNQLKKENYIPVHKCQPVLVSIADILEDLINNNPVINHNHP